MRFLAFFSVSSVAIGLFAVESKSEKGKSTLVAIIASRLSHLCLACVIKTLGIIDLFSEKTSALVFF